MANALSIAWSWHAAWAPFDAWPHLPNPVVPVAPSMVWFHAAAILRAAPDSRRGVMWAAAFGLALAALWELAELIFRAYPLADTLSDVALAVPGAAFGGWLAGRLTGR